MSLSPTNPGGQATAGRAVGRRYATSPAWSLIGIVVGGVVAIQLVPTVDYQLPGALWPAALTLGAGLMMGALVAGLRSTAALFRTEHILCFGLFYWLLLDLLLGQPEAVGVSYDAVVGSFTAITLFAAALWIGSALTAFGSRRRRAADRPIVGSFSPRFLFFAALAAGVLGIARVLLGCRLNPGCMIDALYLPRGSMVWLQIDTFGDFDTVLLYTQYFGFIVLPLTVALITAEGGVTRRSAVTLVLGLSCVLFLVANGGRKDVGTIIGATLLMWALLRPRIRWRHLIGLGLIAGALVIVMQFMLVARQVGLWAALDDPVQLASEETPIGTVDRNFRYLSNIVQLVPERRPYSGALGVGYAVTSWLPGNLGFVPREWQVRSIDLPAEMGMWVPPWFTWTCTAVGDLYLIAGLPAILLGGVLFGVLARLASRLLLEQVSANRLVLYVLTTMTLFMGLRALHEFFVTGFIVLAFVGLAAVNYVMQQGRSPRPAVLQAPRGPASP